MRYYMYIITSFLEINVTEAVVASSPGFLEENNKHGPIQKEKWSQGKISKFFMNFIPCYIFFLSQLMATKRYKKGFHLLRNRIDQLYQF